MSHREWILDRLPLSDSELADSELATLAADPTVSAADLEFARIATRQIAALRALPPPPAFEAISDGRGLDALHESIACEAAAGLPRSVREALTQSLTAPREVDWSAAVLEHLRGSHPSAGPGALESAISPPSHATPGWLWQRIRGDVREFRARPRRARGAWFALAASLMLGVWTATILLGPDRSNPSPLTISFQRVDQPFVTGFSTGSILAEVRRGTR